jgi:hypothetical protein
MRKMLLMAVAAAALIATGAARADMVKLHADMSPSSEVPPVTGAQGKGTMTGTLNTQTKVLDYDITYSGLSGPATMAHIHGPAATGANAPVMYPFPNPASPIKGQATLNDATVSAIMDGKAYVNVHTAANKAGELRGQIQKQ